MDNTQSVMSTRLDAEIFASEAERITNAAALDEWLSLYSREAVADWVVDGVRQHLEGIDQIRPAAAALAGVWREQRIHTVKTVECADEATVVLTWQGGFRAGSRQFGTEIWTLHGGLVVRHQMYGYLGLRSSDSWRGRMRLFFASPRIALSLLKHERLARRALPGSK